MTKEEIIQEYENAVIANGLAAAAGSGEAARSYELFKAGLSALRPVSWERVEKAWKAQDDSPNEKGQWFHCTNCDYGCDDYYSNNEIQMPNNNFQFCPCCGKAVTDEAVQMVMERLEALKGES